MNATLLIIGHNFPEPSTTAAGTRMLQLITLFQEANYAITFASTARHSKHSYALDSMGIEEVTIALNDISFDEFVFLQNPSVVLFDRYITEEQFGWRVAKQCPNALRILDTEDLHFLRKAREAAVKKGQEISLYSETAKRELACILRSDLTLIISEYEKTLLIGTFKVPETLLYYLPFLVEPKSEENKKALPSFEGRQGFMTIGNLMHAPNLDAVKYLKRNIWPQIRKQLPDTTLSVYGHYAPQQITEMHNPKEGFLIKGWASTVDVVMREARVCLAPLRFGAGLKGKLLDAMQEGTPSVTTTIGAEGMHGDLPFSGLVSDNDDTLIANAIQLYTEKESWLELQENGFALVSQRFHKAHFSEAFIKTIGFLQNNTTTHRQEHFIGQVLTHQTTQASKYMSKWIQAKNKR